MLHWNEKFKPLENSYTFTSLLWERHDLTTYALQDQRTNMQYTLISGYALPGETNNVIIHYIQLAIMASRQLWITPIAGSSRCKWKCHSIYETVCSVHGSSAWI